MKETPPSSGSVSHIASLNCGAHRLRSSAQVVRSEGVLREMANCEDDNFVGSYREDGTMRGPGSSAKAVIANLNGNQLVFERKWAPFGHHFQ